MSSFELQERTRIGAMNRSGLSAGRRASNPSQYAALYRVAATTERFRESASRNTHCGMNHRERTRCSESALATAPPRVCTWSLV